MYTFTRAGHSRRSGVSSQGNYELEISNVNYYIKRQLLSKNEGLGRKKKEGRRKG